MGSRLRSNSGTDAPVRVDSVDGLFVLIFSDVAFAQIGIVLFRVMNFLL